MKGFTAEGHFAAAKVDDQFTKKQALNRKLTLHLFGLRGCHLFAYQAHTAQHRFHTCHQFAHTKGLGQIIIGPHFQANDLIHFLRFGSENKNRYAHLLA